MELNCDKDDCVALGTLACTLCKDYSEYITEPLDKEDYYGGR